MQIIGPDTHRAADCEVVLRSLPGWFGIESATQMYVRDSEAFPTFAIEAGDGRLLAFLTLRQHFPEAWEVHCMAVHADARGTGLGTRLLAHGEAWVAGQGGRYLQVKTVAAASPSRHYAQTRAFYAARGFTPLEVFPQLWDPWNPALLCVKVLRVTAPAPPTPASGG